MKFPNMVWHDPGTRWTDPSAILDVLAQRDLEIHDYGNNHEFLASEQNAINAGLFVHQ